MAQEGELNCYTSFRLNFDILSRNSISFTFLNSCFIMQIQINTDNNIEGSARMSAYFTETLEDALSRFQEQITRVVVHLSDENAHKEGGDDKRCLLEARLKGLKPVVVSHNAENIEIAVSGATDKLVKSLESTIGKLRNH
jgi:ribosome-associated translation inhibitor RaiA